MSKARSSNKRPADELSRLRQGGLPHLQLLHEMCMIEYSTLPTLLISGLEELVDAHRPATSAMVEGNAVGLLFEAALLEPPARRAHLVELAEALYGSSSSSEASDDGESSPKRVLPVLDDDESFTPDNSEPLPQRARTPQSDPLMIFWQAHTSPAREMARLGTADTGGPGTRPATQSRSTDTPNTWKGAFVSAEESSLRPGTQSAKIRVPALRRLPPLANDSLQARRSLDAAKQEKQFWANRLKMLYREVDKAQHRVDAARNKDSKFEVSAVINETVAAELAQERRRDMALRLEKAQAIRAHKEAHRTAVRQAHSQIIQDRIEGGKLMKVHQRNHQAIVELMRKRDYDSKCERRAHVQQSKVLAMLKRVREKAMLRDEVTRNYRLKAQHTREEEALCHGESVRYVEESSKLVARIRQLRDVESQLATSDFALRSLEAGMYNAM